jgi:hypothetical protein
MSTVDAEIVEQLSRQVVQSYQENFFIMNISELVLIMILIMGVVAWFGFMLYYTFQLRKRRLEFIRSLSEKDQARYYREVEND